jgi:hypothetical protein
MAQTLLEGGSSMSEVADALAVSQATLYRHLATVRENGDLSGIVETSIILPGVRSRRKIVKQQWLTRSRRESSRDVVNPDGRRKVLWADDRLKSSGRCAVKIIVW